MTKREKAKLVIELLEKSYGNRGTILSYSTPFQLVVAVILSAQCTDVRVNKVTKDLFINLKNAYDFSQIELSQLEQLISSINFYRNKARNIKLCAEALIKNHNGIVPKEMNSLISLPGIGRKTANVILGELHKVAEGIVVDTHIFRVSKRIGLAEGKNPLAVERELMQVIPQDEWIRYGNVAIAHGRIRCKARKPDCDNCEVKELCNYYLSKLPAL